MKSTAGALAFLVARTTRNRLARQVARLKSPRYAIAAAVGLLYFWGVFARPGVRPQSPSPTLGTVGGIGLAITVLTWWLSGGVTGALAFQPAEVQLLFPAPVSRRMLLGYKVARSQLLLLLSCVLWTLLTRSWGVTLSWPLRFATLWGFFSILSLHRLGAALVMAPPVSAGRRVATVAGKALAATAAAALVAGVAPVILRFGSLGFSGGIRALGAALAAPPAGYALAPFRVVTAPLYAATPDAWLRGFAIVVGIVGLHLVWVFGMNVRFEEVAALASADLARKVAAFKERRAGGAAVIRPGKAVRSWLPLAPLGRPAVAIVWKNTVALMRTGVLRVAILIIVVLVAMSGVIWSGDSAATGGGASIPFVTLAAMSLLLGPRAVRNDLRQELLCLASIKTYPLSGATVVFAEMASPTLVLSLFQMVMLALAYLSLPASFRATWDISTTVALGLLAPLVLLSVNAASVGVQNAFALVFPGWVRLGADSGGVEAIGQTMVVTIGSFLVLMISLILPVVSGVVVYALLHTALGGMGLGLAGLVGVVVLGVEVGLLVAALGSLFERTDPTALA